jgi:hypothetical protein
MRIVFETDERKVTVRTTDDDLDISELMQIIYDSLKGLTFSDTVILYGLKELIETIEEK